MKLLSPEDLEKDPYWQVALRDKGYKCSGKKCKNAGCCRCNPKKKK